MLARTSQDLGLLIRNQRRVLGWDQHELAKRVGVSRQWVVEIEGGKPRAELALVLRTLAALGLELEVRTSGQPAEASPSMVHVDLDEVLARARKQP